MIKEYFADGNFEGLAVGLATFLIIGVFHPIVIKSEYYFGVRCCSSSVNASAKAGSPPIRSVHRPKTVKSPREAF